MTALEGQFDGFRPNPLFFVIWNGSLWHSFLSFVTMSPLFIFAYLLISLSIYTKNQKRNILMFVALLTSVVLNKILKRIINQPRPFPELYHGRGMPSDHAQLAFLCGGYFHQLLSHYKRFNWSRFHESRHQRYIAAIWVWALLVTYSRYELLFHDVYQLSAGATIGLGLSVLWYKLDEQFIADNSNGGAYFGFSLHID